MRITLSGGRFLLYLALLAVIAYGGYRLYGEVVIDYIENHPAGQEHRPDIFGQ